MFDHTYLVYSVTPRYHHSTDAFLGMSSKVVEAFNTLEEADQYVIDYMDPAEFDADYYAYVSLMVTWTDADDELHMFERPIAALNANSAYTGPVKFLPEHFNNGEAPF